MLTLTDDKLLKFVLIWGKVVLCLFGEKSWVVPEPFLSYYLTYLQGVPRLVVVGEVESYQQLIKQVPQGGGMCSQQMKHSAHKYYLKNKIALYVYI